MHYFQPRFLICLLAGLGACAGGSAPEVRLEGRTTAAGRQYSVFHPQGLAVRIVTRRPDVADARQQLSVAAAYTDLDTDQPLDLLVSGGQVRQTTPKVGFLNGMLTLAGDSLRIGQRPTEPAALAAVVAQVQRAHGTLLLQELLVLAGKNVHAPGGSGFQRRALAELAGHRFVLVESAADNLTLQAFGDDLLELGARNALYLDMGDWDEGWYKTGRQVVKLGYRRTETARQSNWLVFAERAAPKR